MPAPALVRCAAARILPRCSSPAVQAQRHSWEFLTRGGAPRRGGSRSEVCCQQSLGGKQRDPLTKTNGPFKREPYSSPKDCIFLPPLQPLWVLHALISPVINIVQQFILSGVETCAFERRGSLDLRDRGTDSGQRPVGAEQDVDSAESYDPTKSSPNLLKVVVALHPCSEGAAGARRAWSTWLITPNGVQMSVKALVSRNSASYTKPSSVPVAEIAGCRVKSVKCCACYGRSAGTELGGSATRRSIDLEMQLG